MSDNFFRRVAGYALISFLIVSGGLFFLRTLEKKLDAPPPLNVYGEIPDFQLTERSGKIVSAADLKGKIWVADFIFTRCAAICPLMSNKMQSLQKKFAHEPNLRFVSFSVDPEYDTPEVLKQYAERFEADPGQWLFLTGEKSKIYPLAEQHFHLGVVEIPQNECVENEQPIMHSTKFALVDGEGKIRGYYETDGDADLAPLRRDIQRLLK